MYTIRNVFEDNCLKLHYLLANCITYIYFDLFLLQNALDLTVPASDVLLKSRNNQWFQLSGHPDSLAPAGPGTVWKKRAGGPDDTERCVYEQLSADPHVRDIIPKYFREVDYQGEKFIELQDLLHGFQVSFILLFVIYYFENFFVMYIHMHMKIN